MVLSSTAALGGFAALSLAVMLAGGGHVLMMRHAATQPGVGDPPGYRLDDCASQRNLSEQGRAQSRAIGEALRRAGPNPTRKKLRDALETLRNYDAGGVFINFSPQQHAGSRFVDITILNRAGKLLR